jgi:plasmid stability protein
MKETSMREDALKIPPVEEIEKEILNRTLDPESGWPFEMRAALRVQLGLPPETLPAAQGTTTPPSGTISTNTPSP